MLVSDAIFLVTSALWALFSIRQVVAGRALSVSLTLVSIFIYVICLWVPAHLQASGVLGSKLADAGFAYPASYEEIPGLSLRWTLELILLAFSEFVVWHTRRARAISQTGNITDRDNFWRTVTFTLIAVGAIATVALPVPALEDRAEGGQGIPTLLRAFLITGLALLIYFRAFGKKWAWLIVGAGVLLLIAGNVRSPLLVLVCALLASEIRLGRLRSKRRLMGILALVVAFGLAGSVMSSLRANVTRSYGFTTAQVVQQSLENPWIAPFESGLDTLDGYRFSAIIAENEVAMPADLANAVLTFVPRAVWPEKPATISVQMSAKYLNYRASGQFLSPVGYFTLALGSYPAALVGLFLFGVLMSLLSRRLAATPLVFLVLITEVRFLLGGSSFDLYYFFFLLATIAIASGMVRVARAPVRYRAPSRDTFSLSPVMGPGSPNI